MNAPEKIRSKVFSLSLLLLLLLVIYVSPLGAGEYQEQEEEVFQELRKEKTSVPYIGTLVSVLFSSPVAQAATFLIYSLNENIERREQLSPSGKSRGIILLDGTNRWEYIPSHRVITKTPLPIRQGRLMKNLQMIKQNYVMKKIGEGQIANRYTLILQFMPRVADRPQRLIWIDKEYKFPLRVEVYGVNGDLTQFITFTHITFYPVFPEGIFTLQAPEDTTVLATEKRNQLTWKELEQFVSFSPLLPHYLPPGFVLIDMKGEKSADTELIQLLYSDGLSYLSVFQEKQSPEPTGLTTLTTSSPFENKEITKYELVEHGLLHIITGYTGEIAYSIVGEVTQEELRKIAHSLHVP